MRGSLGRLSALLGGASAVAVPHALSAPAPREKSDGGPSTAPYLCSTSTYPANDPIEDRYDVAVKGGKLFAAVLDGHGGWQAAEYARRNLLATVAAELANASDADVPSQVATALSRAFQRIDRSFLSAVRPAFELGFGEVAHVGACALAAVVSRSHVVVANAGDCRAVLGRVLSKKPESGPWVAGRAGGGEIWYAAVPLSLDHNARETRERTRLEVSTPRTLRACHAFASHSRPPHPPASPRLSTQARRTSSCASPATQMRAT
jgi:hypothetical protein